MIALIKRIKRRWKYSRCYGKMHNSGRAFLMTCNGKNKHNPNTGTKHPNRKCLYCPYFERTED